MAPKLEYAFTLRTVGSKEDFVPFGPVKGGPTRFVINVPGGDIEGPEVKAKFISGGSDWFHLDTATGVGQMDLRATGKTEEGETICLRLTGIVKMDDQLQESLSWGPGMKTTRSEDHYWIVTPTFETNSERLKWMEQNVFIGHGHILVPGEGTQSVEFEVYKVVSA
jgi:Protein of unknown function (DUF3237)